MLTIRRTTPLDMSAEDACLGPAPWIVDSPPGPSAAAVIARDRHACAASVARLHPLVVRRARGAVIEDVDGNRFLDFASGLAGHCLPRVTAAIRCQAENMIQESNGFCYSPTEIGLAEKLAQIVPGDAPRRVLLVPDGTEGLALAQSASRRHSGRPWVVVFSGELSGDTEGASRDGALLSGISSGETGSHVGVVTADYGDADSVGRALGEHGLTLSEVAAVIVEPLRIEGEFVMPAPEFLPQLRELCTRHGILLVVDETHIGPGQTGRLFCTAGSGIGPDIVCVDIGRTSGMPLAAVIVRGDLPDVMEAASSFAPVHPVNCAAGMVVIELVEKSLADHVADLNGIAVQKLGAIASRRRCIDRVRGLGLLLCVDVVRNRRTHEPHPRLRDRIVEEAFQRGVVLLPCGASSIRIRPALCINRIQLEVGLDVVDEAIATVQD